MKIKPFHGLNPADAYRRHGARYGFFVFAKASALVLNLALAVITLCATYAASADWELYEWCQSAAMITLKLIGATVPFVLFEALYWRYRLRRLANRMPTHDTNLNDPLTN